MIGKLMIVLGAILVFVAVLKYLGVIAIASAAASTLLIVGIVLLMLGYVLFGQTRAGNRGPLL